MKIFDLHCDTIGECFKNKLPLIRNELDIDLIRASRSQEHIQVFAIWIPDELRGNEASVYFNDVCDYFYEELEKNRDVVSMLGSGRQTPVKAVLAIEGGSGTGGTLDGLEKAYKRGVRLVTLTWNACNEIASGAFSEGGFTEYGREFVSCCEKLGIVIDVSHLNRQSFSELCGFAQKPFIASHSNANIVNSPNGTKRNLDDFQIEEIRKRNSLIGLNFYNAFLEDEKARGIEALKRQLDYFIARKCEKIIALGTDYDGCRITDGFGGVEKLPVLYSKLLEAGYPEALLNDLFYENAKRFFADKL